MITLRPEQEPIVHQAVEKLMIYRIVYLACEVRTGKTIMALSIFNFIALKLQDTDMALQRGLFITKKKAMSSIQSDYDLLQPNYHLDIINYESLHKLNEDDYDFAIIDEAHSLGAFPKPSLRTRTVRKFVYNLPVILMSGTPSPESYSQLYHQFWVSKRTPFAEHNFYQWARVYVDIYQRMINSMRRNQYERAKKPLIDEKISKYFVSLTQKEAGFQAEVDETVIRVPMTHKAVGLYRILKRDDLIKMDEGVASCTNGADKINKLRQLSSGTIILDKEFEQTVIFDYSKLEYIVQNFSDKKIAIFYVYKAERQMLLNVFPNYTEDSDKFNASNDLTYIGQVQSSSMGVNLATADALVMLNISFSATHYWQARARIQSKAREGTAPLYWIFSGHGIESQVLKAVQSKKNFTHSYYVRKENTKGNKELSRRTQLVSRGKSYRVNQGLA